MCNVFSKTLGSADSHCSFAADAVPLSFNLRRGCTGDVRQCSCGRLFLTDTSFRNSRNFTCNIKSTDFVSPKIILHSILFCVVW